MLEAESSEEMFDKERELVEIGSHSYNLKEGGYGGFGYINSNHLNVLMGERNPMKRADVVKKISDALKNHIKTNVHRKRISNSLKGRYSPRGPYKLKPGRKYLSSRKSIQVQCPYCNKIGGSYGMGRWHFENCRNKM